MKRLQDDGYMLLSLLFAALAIGVLVAGITQLALSSIQIEGLYISGFSQKNKQLQERLNEALDLPRSTSGECHFTKDQGICFQESPFDQQSLREQRILQGIIDGKKRAFPRFDFYLLSPERGICTETFPNIIYNRSQLGFTLSRAAIVAKQGCSKFKGDAEGRFTGYYNVSSENLTMDTELHTIVVGGYLELKTLTLLSDTIILAAGDIHIGTVERTGAADTSLTIISTTGIVDIKKLPFSLYGSIFCKLGCSLPHLPLHPAHRLPPVIEREIYSIGH